MTSYRCSNIHPGDPGYEEQFIEVDDPLVALDLIEVDDDAHEDSYDGVEVYLREYPDVFADNFLRRLEFAADEQSEYEVEQQYMSAGRFHDNYREHAFRRMRERKCGK